MYFMESIVKWCSDTQANWELNNPILANAEAGWDETNKRFKIGDGVSAWNILPYFTLNLSDIKFDKTGSNLEAMNPQQALHEIEHKIPEVVDEIDTTFTHKALSANQGRILKELISNLPKSKSFNDVFGIVSVLNPAPNSLFVIGNNIYDERLSTPDYWVSSVEATSVPYTYTTDEQFWEDALNGDLQVGFYKLKMLGTEKVDLTDYIKNTDYATDTKAGIISYSYANGFNKSTDNKLQIAQASATTLSNRNNACQPITSKNYDYAFKKAITDNENAPQTGDYTAVWTNQDKAKARALFNAEEQLRVETTNPQTLQDNVSYDLTATPVTTLTFNCPEVITSRFNCEASFITGETITLTTNNITFKGEDCSSSGVFDIQPNTSYYINFMKFGTGVVGFVAII